MGKHPKATSTALEHQQLFLAEHGPDACWPWPKALSRKGYGQYRWMYTSLVGALPVEADLDHECNNASCVNPRHLVVRTHRDNLMRSRNFVAERAAQTQCINGHEFDSANTRIRPNGCRDCRTCRRLREAARVDAKRRGVPYVSPFSKKETNPPAPH